MGGMRTVGEMRSALRSSLPDMSKPAKIYDLAILQTTNKKLPEGVDRYDLHDLHERQSLMTDFGD